MKRIRITGRATVEASGRVPTIEIDAYNGGAMRPEQPRLDAPLVIDLASASAGTLSILEAHDSERVIGQSTSVSISQANVNVKGIITGDVCDETCPAGRTVGHAKRGYTWKASLGGDIPKLEFIDAGQSVNVNGQVFSGPLYVARATVFDEVSLLSLSADKTTSAKIAASRRKEFRKMDLHQFIKDRGLDPSSISDTTRAALESDRDVLYGPGNSEGGTPFRGSADERDAREAEGFRLRSTARRDVAAALCEQFPQQGEEVDRLLAEADQDNMSAKAFQLKAQRALATQIDNRPRGVTGAAGKVDVLTCAMAMANSIRVPEGRFSAATREQADKMLPSLPFILNAAAKADRLNAHTGYSTHDFSNATIDFVELGIVSSYAPFGSEIDKIAQVRSVKNFHIHESQQVYSIDGRLEEVPAGGEIKHMAGGSVGTKHAASTFAKMFTWDRRDEINDAIGKLGEFASNAALEARRSLVDRLCLKLLANRTRAGAEFFSAGNSNLLTGGDKALSSTSLALAKQKFREQTDPDGRPIGLKPRYLAVPPSLEFTAEILLKSSNLARDPSEGDLLPSGNPHQDTLELIVDPRLSSTAFHASASSTAWFLFGAPLPVAPVIASFLNGKTTPVFERIAMDSNVLGSGFRIYFDFDFDLADYRAALKSAGA